MSAIIKRRLSCATSQPSMSTGTSFHVRPLNSSPPMVPMKEGEKKRKENRSAQMESGQLRCPFCCLFLVARHSHWIKKHARCHKKLRTTGEEHVALVTSGCAKASPRQCHRKLGTAPSGQVKNRAAHPCRCFHSSSFRIFRLRMDIKPPRINAVSSLHLHTSLPVVWHTHRNNTETRPSGSSHFHFLARAFISIRLPE